MEDNKEISNNSEYAGLGFGITSLVFSIISIVMFSFIIISVACALIAVATGIVSAIKKNGLGKAGLIMGIIVLVLTVVLFFLLNVIGLESLFMVPEWYK